MSRAGKTYFITGGASGLGLQTAKALVAEGANVAIADRDKDLGVKAEKEFAPLALFVELDVTDKASCQAGIQKTVEKFGTLSGIINCAGVGSAFMTVDKNHKPHNDKMFDMVTKINLYGTFFCASEGAAAMSKLPADADGERGVIVNVASVAAFEGQKGQLAYSASKGAVVGMTLPMARDLARFGIRVCTIAPGIIDTPLMQGAAPKVKEGLLAQVAHPKRFGQPDEFATLVKAIIDCGYLNGETIRMDAGIRFANL